MHHAVYDGSDDDEISEVIAKLAKAYVRCYDRSSFALPAVYNFEEQ
jgi:hypothetical protein